MEQLIKSASLIKQPSQDSFNEYRAKRESIVSQFNVIMKNRHDLNRLIGEQNLEMMENNHRNHARFMESVFLQYESKVFVETILWVFRAYRSHGFQLTYWSAMLDTMVDLLRNELTEKCFAEIYPFYHWMIINIPEFTRLSDRSTETAPNE